MEIPKIDFRSASDATGGTFASPWYQGDQVVSYAGDARSGDRTAPAAGSLAGAVGGSGLKLPLIAAAVIVGGALLWKRLR